MSPSSIALAEATDAELLSRTRDGSDDAFAELFTRHRGIALGVARKVAGVDRADDLVAEAFTRVLAALQAGGGPDEAFRSYLLTTVRNLHLTRIRNTRREALVPDYEDVERELVIPDGIDDLLEARTAARAFAALPERWQTVLWLGTVEGRRNDEIARILDLKPNAVAALSFRARDGLRQAYLADHLREVDDPGCRAATEQIPAFVRGTLTRRRSGLLQAHLDGCRRCAATVAELEQVDARLAAYLAPLVFVPVLTSTSTGSGVLAAVGGWFAKLGTAGKAVVLTATVGPVLTATVVAGPLPLWSGGAAEVPGPADRSSVPIAVDLFRPPAPGRSDVSERAVPRSRPTTRAGSAAVPDTVPAPGHSGGAQPPAAVADDQVGAPSGTTAPPRTEAPPTSAPAATWPTLAQLVQQLVNGIVQVPLSVAHAVLGTTMTISLTGAPGSSVGFPSGFGWACAISAPDSYAAASWTRTFTCRSLGWGGDPVVTAGPGLQQVRVALGGITSSLTLDRSAPDPA